MRYCTPRHQAEILEADEESSRHDTDHRSRAPRRRVAGRPAQAAELRAEVREGLLEGAVAGTLRPELQLVRNVREATPAEVVDAPGGRIKRAGRGQEVGDSAEGGGQ